MPSSLSAALDEVARKAPGVTAIRSADGALSYGAMTARMEDLALLLGVQRGERIGILLPNLPELPLAFHAILAGGGSAVLLNPLSSGREIDENLRDAGVRRVITGDSLAGRVAWPRHSGSRTRDRGEMRRRMPCRQRPGRRRPW